MKANTNSTNCGTINLNNATAGNYDTCIITNWLYRSNSWWVINPYSNSTYSGNGWHVSTNGYFNVSVAVSTEKLFPVLFLSSDIKLLGDGSKDNAYKIVS